MDKRKKLATLSVMYQGDWDKIAKALQDDVQAIDIPIKDSYITIYDSEYPDSLRKLRFPPWVLFYSGDISLLRKPMLTMIGSRQMTDYAKWLVEESVMNLKERFVLVSGLAKGVDGYVHTMAIQGGHTIAVIGSGLDIHYPYENEHLYQQLQKTDLILSEYPSGTGVRKHHFPWRNRILAALGESVIVIAAKIRSGTMCTVNEAISLDKDIYVFPHLYRSEQGMGCNKLIADGAQILYDTIQIKEMIPKKDD